MPFKTTDCYLLLVGTYTSALQIKWGTSNISSTQRRRRSLIVARYSLRPCKQDHDIFAFLHKLSLGSDRVFTVLPLHLVFSLCFVPSSLHCYPWMLDVDRGCSQLYRSLRYGTTDALSPPAHALSARPPNVWSDFPGNGA